MKNITGLLPKQKKKKAGSTTPFPVELKRWNWGAFFLSWIWGIGHGIWITLLLIPISLWSNTSLLGPLIVFCCALGLGFKGNELAWRYHEYQDVAEFRRIERIWALWGFIFFIIVMTMGFVFVGVASRVSSKAHISNTIPAVRINRASS